MTEKNLSKALSLSDSIKKLSQKINLLKSDDFRISFGIINNSSGLTNSYIHLKDDEDIKTEILNRMTVELYEMQKEFAKL